MEHLTYDALFDALEWHLINFENGNIDRDELKRRIIASFTRL